jgi:hypothetical protein
MRPEAEQRLRAGFQRRVDERRDRYAAQLAHAGQLAAWYECGEVIGVFSRQADIGRQTVITGLLPLVAVPFLIVGAAAGVPGMLPAFGFFLFFFIAWHDLSLWRGCAGARGATPSPAGSCCWTFRLGTRCLCAEGRSHSKHGYSKQRP